MGKWLARVWKAGRCDVIIATMIMITTREVAGIKGNTGVTSVKLGANLSYVSQHFPNDSGHRKFRLDHPGRRLHSGSQGAQARIFGRRWRKVEPGGEDEVRKNKDAPSMVVTSGFDVGIGEQED